MNAALLQWAFSVRHRTGLFLLFGLSVAGQARAQERGNLTGTVQNTAGTAVEFATITLHRAADSTVIKTEFSDEKGAFRFEQAPVGRYLVSTSQVGFNRHWTQPFELSAAGLALPAIALQASGATALKEVTVVGKKPLFERQADRTVVNVEGSTLAAGNTSLDVLARSPGVTIDGSDNLKLRGKQGLLVLIDGKRQPMSGTELADYLRALPADQLKSIELITNPPAKYDAQGGAGIIAINLKKDQRQGMNGTLTANYGRGKYDKFGTGLNLNYRKKKVNLFGSYNYADRQNYSKLTIHRDFYRDSVLAGDTRPSKVFTGSSDQENGSVAHGTSHSWKGGLDYTLSERTLLGAVVSGLDSRRPDAGSNFSSIYDAEGALQSRYQSTNDQNGHSANVAGNRNFRHTFPADSAGTRELSADADFATYTRSRQQTLSTRFSLPGNGTALLNGDQNGDLTIQSIKADYVHPFSKTLRLDAGAKVSWVNTNNKVLFTNAEGVPDLNQSNEFRYDENINAGYVTLSKTLPKLSYSAGLRGEHTNATGRQLVGNDNFERNYFQLFPSASLKRTLNDKHEVALSLSRRIDRPTYNQLNPFRSYIDRTTFGSGNKDLLPQTSYNIEFTHTYRQKFSTGMSYSLTDKPVIGTVQPLNDTSRFVVSRDNNLKRQEYYAFTFTAPVEPTKWWSIYNNAVVYYSRFIGDLSGTALNRGRAAFNLSSNSSFKLGKDWSADLNASYQSRELYGFLDVSQNGQLTLGVQKRVWDGKGTFKLNATDVLYTSPIHAISTYNNYVERFYQRGESRVVTLSFNYRFGNDKLAPSRRRNGGAEDEKRRAG